MTFVGPVTGIFVLLKNCPRIKIFRKFLSYPNKICSTSHRTKIFRKVSENFCPRIKVFSKASENFYPRTKKIFRNFPENFYPIL